MIQILIVFLIVIITLIKYYITPIFMYYIMGKKQYLGETLLSMGGIGQYFKWFKNDEEALEIFKYKDFIYIIYPKKYRIKPK